MLKLFIISSMVILLTCIVMMNQYSCQKRASNLSKKINDRDLLLTVIQNSGNFYSNDFLLRLTNEINSDSIYKPIDYEYKYLSCRKYELEGPLYQKYSICIFRDSLNKLLCTYFHNDEYLISKIKDSIILSSISPMYTFERNIFMLNQYLMQSKIKEREKHILYIIQNFIGLQLITTDYIIEQKENLLGFVMTKDKYNRLFNMYSFMKKELASKKSNVYYFKSKIGTYGYWRIEFDGQSNELKLNFVNNLDFSLMYL